MIYDHPADIVGGGVYTLLPDLIERFDTYLKVEGLNPAGSIKLKTARGLLRQAEAEGVARPGAHFIESTSGNLGIALASVCAARGYRLTLVTDPNTTALSHRHMRALGASVVTVAERDRNGGYLHSRIDYIVRRVGADPGLVWLNQYANRANPEEHSLTTATEILTEFGAPDWLFVGVGTSGTLMGCVDRFAQARARTRIVGVDAAGSINFGGPAGVRHIPGLGASRRPELLVNGGGFEKVTIAEAAAVRACRRLAREYGLLVGGSTGSVLAAVAAVAPKVRPGSRVLALSADLGDRYLDTVYDDAWVADRYGPYALTDESVPARRVAR